MHYNIENKKEVLQKLQDFIFFNKNIYIFFLNLYLDSFFSFNFYFIYAVKICALLI